MCRGAQAHDVRGIFVIQTFSPTTPPPPIHRAILLCCCLTKPLPPYLAFATTTISTTNAMNATTPRAFRSFTAALVNGAPWRAPQCLFTARRSASSTSSTIWKTRQQSDHFRRKAEVEGLKSRAAFKLLEINETYRIFRRGQTVVDLVSGGQTQQLLSRPLLFPPVFKHWTKGVLTFQLWHGRAMHLDHGVR